jgi:hypothetical protein
METNDTIFKLAARVTKMLVRESATSAYAMSSAKEDMAAMSSAVEAANGEAAAARAKVGLLIPAGKLLAEEKAKDARRSYRAHAVKVRLLSAACADDASELLLFPRLLDALAIGCLDLIGVGGARDAGGEATRRITAWAPSSAGAVRRQANGGAAWSASLRDQLRELAGVCAAHARDFELGGEDEGLADIQIGLEGSEPDRRRLAAGIGKLILSGRLPDFEEFGIPTGDAADFLRAAAVVATDGEGYMEARALALAALVEEADPRSSDDGQALVERLSRLYGDAGVLPEPSSEPSADDYARGALARLGEERALFGRWIAARDAYNKAVGAVWDAAPEERDAARSLADGLRAAWKELEK